MNKKILLLILLIFSISKNFADCYFSFDGFPMTMTNKKNASGEKLYGYYISGSFGLAASVKEDNFKENKTGYAADLFTEIQFIGRAIPNQSNSSSEEYRYDNDIYCSAGLTFLELVRPKFSYGLLSKDFFVSCVFGIPIPFDRKFINNETSICGFQIHAGLEPVWNITDKDSFTAPSYLNFRANFKIYLDFSRKTRYAEYTEKQKQIQIQKAEEERKAQEQKLEAEQQERINKKLKDERIAKEQGYSSVEEYYKDEYARKQVEERISAKNFYNQVIYHNGIPLEIGDDFTIPSDRLEVIDRAVGLSGYTYLVTYYSSPAQKSIDYARSFSGGGQKYCFYIRTKKELALHIDQLNTIYTKSQFMTNMYPLKIICSGIEQYESNFQSVDCYAFELLEEDKSILRNK